MYQIREKLKEILGEDALSIGKMQVSERVSRLAKAVDYLALQIEMTIRAGDDEQRKSHVNNALAQVRDILSKNDPE